MAKPSGPVQIAFDIGGTFTDFVLQDPANGTMRFWKVPSTPDNPSRAVVSGLEDLLAASGVEGPAVEVILHATTVATNAIIERKGPKTAFVTTKGFRDVLIMGRQKRYDTFDIYLTKPAPLVDRKDVFEVDERIDVHGETVKAVDPESVAETVDAIVAEATRRRPSRSFMLMWTASTSGWYETPSPRTSVPAGLHLQRSLAEDARVRAVQYHPRQCVREAGGGGAISATLKSP